MRTGEEMLNEARRVYQKIFSEEINDLGRPYIFDQCMRAVLMEEEFKVRVECTKYQIGMVLEDKKECVKT